MSLKENEESKQVINAEKAAFSILSFRISQVLLNATEDAKGQELQVGFTPSGIYNSKSGEFELILNCIMHKSGKHDEPNLKVTLLTYFKFAENLPLAKLPEYFYRNSIAIVYPYLRAYISTLTAQGNNDLIILPLMNLSSLEKPLRENTKEI